MHRSAAALGLLLSIGIAAQPQRTPAKLTVLVGGTLIDGYAGPPIRNSIVLIDGDRITAVGQVGTLAVPQGADVISTEGMSVLPGLTSVATTTPCRRIHARPHSIRNRRPPGTS